MDEAALEGMGVRLAATVAEELRAGRSETWRCPPELRSQVVVHAGLCRERVETLGDIAARLGLVESTLARWLRYEKSHWEPSSRPVTIVPRVEESSDHRPGVGQAGLRLITPRGYHVG